MKKNMLEKVLCCGGTLKDTSVVCFYSSFKGTLFPKGVPLKASHQPQEKLQLLFVCLNIIYLFIHLFLHENATNRNKKLWLFFLSI